MAKATTYKEIGPLRGRFAGNHSGKKSRRDAGATNMLEARARWMGDALPSIGAGHGMPCPYEIKNRR